MKEDNKSSPVHDYLIPVRLVVIQEPYGANETVLFQVQPKLIMVDKLNRTVIALGHGYQGQWYVVLSFKQVPFCQIFVEALEEFLILILQSKL